MPVAKRTTKRYRWDPELRHLALQPSQWEQYFGGSQAGREAWEALRGQPCGNPTTRPDIFWWYEGPKELQRSEWMRRHGDSFEEIAAEWRRLRNARLNWLLDHPEHHRPGEGKLIVNRLQREE